MEKNLIGAGVLGLLFATTALAQTNTPTTVTTNGPISMAELPFWPVGMKLPDAVPMKKPPKDRSKAEIMAWAPPGAKHIRAMIIIPNNSDSKDWSQHAAVREVCIKREVGIVYLRNFPADLIEFSDQPDTNSLQIVLNAVAEQTGIAEFRHAPWITFGKSSRGRFPFRMAWLFPERTIACISYHGETPTWPMPPWSHIKDETILQVNANGQDEWDRTWYQHVRPSLLNYRAQTAWLPHQVVAYGVGHGNYVDVNGSPGWGKPVPPGTMSVLRVWDYLAVFVDKAVALRVPTDKYPTDGPLKLKQVDPDTGYLIHPRAVEEFLGAKWRPLRQTDGVYTIVDHIKEPGEVFDPNPGKVDASLLIRKATDVPAAERKGLFWVADKEQADAWLKLHTPPK